MQLPSLDKHINPYLAFLAITVVGSGAALAILRAIEVAEALASYSVLP